MARLVECSDYFSRSNCALVGSRYDNVFEVSDSQFGIVPETDPRSFYDSCSFVADVIDIGVGVGVVAEVGVEIRH